MYFIVYVHGVFILDMYLLHFCINRNQFYPRLLAELCLQSCSGRWRYPHCWELRNRSHLLSLYTTAAQYCGPGKRMGKLIVSSLMCDSAHGEIFSLFHQMVVTTSPPHPSSTNTSPTSSSTSDSYGCEEGL